MLTATSEFKAEVAGQSMRCVAKVVIALPGDVDVTMSVKTVNIQESITTSAPSGSGRRYVGNSARTVDVTIAGAQALQMNPFDPGGPLYGQRLRGRAITIYLGLMLAESNGEPELKQRFTGTIDTWVLDPSDETIALTCIDGRNELRTQTNIPAVSTAPPYNAGLTNEYVIDAALRSGSNGAISSWPAQRPNCLLAIGFRTSLWAEVGDLDEAALNTSAFAPGIWGSALGHGGGAGYALDGEVGDDFYIEFAVTASATLTSGTGYGISAGNPTLGYPNWSLGPALDGSGQVLTFAVDRFDSSAYTFPVAITPGHHTIALALHWPVGSDTWSATLTVDGLRYSSGPQAAPGARGSASVTSAGIFSGSASTIEALQISNEVDPTPSFAAFTPRAVLDRSKNVLAVIPSFSGDPWQPIQQACDSENGYCGFTSTGDVVFRNRDSLRTGASVRAISNETSLKGYQVADDASTSYTAVQASWIPYTFKSPSVVWALADLITVPAGGTIVITAQFDGLAVNVPTDIIARPDDHATTGQNYFRFSVDKDGSADHTGVTGSVKQITNQVAEITLTNSTGTDAYCVSSADHTDVPAGQPYLVLAGVPVQAGDAQTIIVGDTSPNQVLYQAPDTPFAQDAASITALANDDLTGFQNTGPHMQNVSIVLDPTLELADVVTLVHPRMHVDHNIVILGQNIQIDIDAETVDHTIDADALTWPGAA